MTTIGHLLRQAAWMALAVCATLFLLLLSMSLGQPFGPVERLTLLITTALLGWAAVRLRQRASRSR